MTDKRSSAGVERREKNRDQDRKKGIIYKERIPEKQIRLIYEFPLGGDSREPPLARGQKKRDYALTG